VPFSDTPMVGTWVLIMMAYAVRRLPYALRSCMAALQQVHISLEEAANSLGAGKLSTARRVMVPLMAGGILAGFVTSFITAAVELSATILLTSSEAQAPIANSAGFVHLGAALKLRLASDQVLLDQRWRRWRCLFQLQAGQVPPQSVSELPARARSPEVAPEKWSS
jgi:ABC-type phosphate transport system permease subunit